MPMSGKDIKRMRTRLGISQGELGSRLMVTRETVNRWETGKATPMPIFNAMLSKLFAKKKRKK
jgi:DNA-binding transcriptional regulator YiaG